MLISRHLGNRSGALISRKFSRIASLAQLVARRSHNPKVVSSILTGSIFHFLKLFNFGGEMLRVFCKFYIIFKLIEFKLLST